VPEIRKRKLLVCALFLAVGLGPSCAHRKAVVAPEPQAGTESQKAAPASPEGGTTTVKPEPRISAAETPESAVHAGELPASVEEINKAGYLKDAFFDTDKADLRPDTRDLLAADAAWLKDHPSVKLLVEGHCDERNTEEYNLALGWRRCNAVKAYLAQLGVGTDRISTISYGEEKPFATCHNESCWWQNRRAHFVVTAR
jgi:peptidoglycan-associated lipoprotein